MLNAVNTLTIAVRINRYIMECKFVCRYINNFSLCELIDTLWNVNLTIVPSFGDSAGELIDTLWNVNSKWLCDVLRRDFELIDTLWNVNDIGSPHTPDKSLN